MFAVNADAYFFIAQAAIPHLLETRGNIVNIASNSGLMGGAYTVAYCMTKGAVVQLTRALAMEFMKRKIRINAIAPGATDTGHHGRCRVPGRRRLGPDHAIQHPAAQRDARADRRAIRVRRQ